MADLPVTTGAAVLAEATLDTPEEAIALRAAAATRPGLRWRLRPAPALIAAARRWPDPRARADALWLIEHAEQVLWRDANAPPAVP